MKIRKDMRALSLLMVLALIGAIFVPVVSATEAVVINEPENTMTKQELDNIYATLIADIKSCDIDTALEKKLVKSLNDIRNNKLSDTEKLNVLIEVSEILLSSNSDEVSTRWSGYT